MRSSKKLLSLAFLSLIISSFAQLEDVSPSPSVASDGSHISISPINSLSPSPSPAADPTTATTDPTSTTPVGPTDSSVESICNSTDYPDLCVSAIGSSLSKKPDSFKALEITIKTAVDTTHFAIQACMKIGNLPITPPNLASILKDVVGSLEDALDNFKQAQDALLIKDWGTVNTMLSGAMTNFGDCEDQLNGQDVPMLTEFSEKLTKMTSNSLALSAIFDPQPGF